VKSRTLTCMSAMTLFGALATPVQLTAQQEIHYTVTDLGTLGGTFSQAFSLNNHGSVVGFSTLNGDIALHAFFWRDGIMTDLGTLGGSDTLPYSSATNVNDRDEVIGFSETSTPDPLGENFCGDSLVCLPVVWRAGVMTPLGTLGGTNAVGVSINNRSEVIGFAETSAPDPTCVPPQTLHVEPATWHRTTINELPTFPGDPDGIAASINDADEATLPTGDCVFFGPPSGHDSLLRHGSLTGFGSFGGNPIAANDINNRGQVTGVTVNSAGNEVEAIIWQDGVTRGLGFLPGDVVSIGSAINDTGEVTGQSCGSNGNCRGFLWRDGVMMDLATLVPPSSNLDFPDPTGINSRGQIVGLGIQKNTGEFHGFLMTPTNGEVGNESTTSAAPGRFSVGRELAFPENARRALQRLGHHSHIPGLGKAKD
jgi:probable HAF family extracellular repeat protein